MFTYYSLNVSDSDMGRFSPPGPNGVAAGSSETVYRLTMSSGRLCLMLMASGLSAACGGKLSELGAEGKAESDAPAAAGTGGAASASGASTAGGDGGAGPEPCAGGATFVYVLGSVATIRTTTTGSGEPQRETFGFDLDGRDSDGTRPDDCGITDVVSSDGRTGIDNAIAGLSAEDFAPGAERALTNPNTLTTIRLSGVDSFEDDSCVDVTWSDEVPQFKRAKIEAGRLRADGAGLVRITGVAPENNSASYLELPFPLASPRIAFRATPDALTEGVLGGSLTIEQLRRDYVLLVGQAFTKGIFESPGRSIIHPDLPADGQPCVLLSAGFAFEAAAVPHPTTE
jgi:hypothetical protein